MMDELGSVLLMLAESLSRPRYEMQTVYYEPERDFRDQMQEVPCLMTNSKKFFPFTFGGGWRVSVQAGNDKFSDPGNFSNPRETRSLPVRSYNNFEVAIIKDGALTDDHKTWEDFVELAKWWSPDFVQKLREDLGLRVPLMVSNEVGAFVPTDKVMNILNYFAKKFPPEREPQQTKEQIEIDLLKAHFHKLEESLGVGADLISQSKQEFETDETSQYAGASVVMTISKCLNLLPRSVLDKHGVSVTLWEELAELFSPKALLNNGGMLDASLLYDTLSRELPTLQAKLALLTSDA